MGGAVCNVHRQAVLRFTTVPTLPVPQAQFDEQIRKLYTLVAQDVVNEGKGMEACAILAKPHFDMADRAALLDIIEDLYEPYP